MALIKRVKRYAVTIVIVVLIAYLSLAEISSPTDIQKFPYADKAVHIVMYLSLMMGIYVDIHRQRLSRKAERQHLLWGALIAIFFGGMMEVAQLTLTRYRSGDWMDLIADAVGVLLGLWISKRLFRFVDKGLSHRFGTK